MSSEKFKRYIADTRYRIRLHDLLVGEVKTFRAETSDDKFPVREVQNVADETYLVRVSQYELLAGPLMEMMAIGGYWGDEEQAHLLCRCLSRLADPPGERGGAVAWLNLRIYPAMLLAYACGIGAVLGRRDSTLSKLLVSTRSKKGNKRAPLVRVLSHNDVIDENVFQRRAGLERKKTPLSDHLYEVLKKPLSECSIDECEYQCAFDRFEYLFCLAHGDVYEKEGSFGQIWGPLGCFLWRKGVLEDVGQEIAESKGDWPLLKEGLFGGSLDRLRHVKEKIDGIVHGNLS
jgi:hypothetical protein